MRIVAGHYGGRIIQGPRSSVTRPMTDKVRAALFDMMGDISGDSVLDAYAGSGSVGFEALSRGAAQVAAIESNRSVGQLIRHNQQSLEVAWGYSLYPVMVESWLARPENRQLRFDLIIADPPYDQLKPDVLEQLGGRLKPGGRLVVSLSAKLVSPSLDGLSVELRRDYGDSALVIYALR